MIQIKTLKVDLNGIRTFDNVLILLVQLTLIYASLFNIPEIRKERLKTVHIYTISLYVLFILLNNSNEI